MQLILCQGMELSQRHETIHQKVCLNNKRLDLEFLTDFSEITRAQGLERRRATGAVI